MELYNHNNYDKYVKTQRQHVTNHCNNLRKRKTKPDDYDNIGWVKKKYLDRIYEEIRNRLDLDKIDAVICHAVRCGYESKYFMDKFGVDKVYSTDLSSEAFMFDRKHFYVQDFDVLSEEWVGKFDFLYSNSIDHSRQPAVTLINWGRQLKDTGLMAVTFSWGPKVTDCDCFALNENGGEKTGDKYNYLIELEEFIKDLNLEIVYGSDPYEGIRVADVIFRRSE